MIQFHIHPIPLLLLTTFLSLSISIQASNCTRTCGSTTVLYPFGFSAGCNINLTCTNANILIGEFRVRNITSDAILLDVPPSCNRSIQTSHSFFGQNYAMTNRSGLFLRNCSSTNSSCRISTDLISSRLDLQKCGAKDDDISCFSEAKARGFVDVVEMKQTGCGYLFTSVWYDYEIGNITALVFSTVELGWWMEGECKCSSNSNCITVQLPVNGKMGFRCKCDEGFVGDGFKEGFGCSKVVSGCNSVNSKSDSCGSNARIVILTGGIIGGASLILVAALFIYFIRRRIPISKTTSTKFLLSEASFDVPLYSYKVIERATNYFSQTHHIGTGSYGNVYVGHLANGDLVAVKKLKNHDPENIHQIINEIKLISSLNHPNLVRLLGCCIERGEQILLYELMANGTLSQHLQRQRGPGLPWTIRLTIAEESAKAIAHLHSAVDPPIYHRDIKSSNILLDQNFHAKIADFGLSRTVVSDFSHISTAPQGTPGYVDPQYHQNFHLSDKSDVYSFGVVLVEIITGLKVVDFGRVKSEVNLAQMAVDRIGKGRVEEIIDSSLGVKKDDGWLFVSVHKVAELAFRCLAFDRDMRPSMMEVADELEQIRDSVWEAKDGELIVEERVKEKVSSPVSVQYAWISEQNTPSGGSLLSSSKRSN